MDFNVSWQAELEKKALEEEFPKFFGFFEKLLKENAPNGVFVGKDVSIPPVPRVNGQIVRHNRTVKLT